MKVFSNGRLMVATATLMAAYANFFDILFSLLNALRQMDCCVEKGLFTAQKDKKCRITPTVDERSKFITVSSKPFADFPAH